MRTNAQRAKSKNKILFPVFISKTGRAAHRRARKRSATVDKEEQFFPTDVSTVRCGGSSMIEKSKTNPIVYKCAFPRESRTVPSPEFPGIPGTPPEPPAPRTGRLSFNWFAVQTNPNEPNENRRLQMENEEMSGFVRVLGRPNEPNAIFLEVSTNDAVHCSILHRQGK